MPGMNKARRLFRQRRDLGSIAQALARSEWHASGADQLSRLEEGRGGFSLRFGKGEFAPRFRSRLSDAG